MNGRLAVKARLFSGLTIAVILAIAARIASLNALYMERKPCFAPMGHSLRCDWATPLNTTLDQNELSIRATSFRIISQREERSLAGSYVDPVLESGGAAESKLAIVEIAMANIGDRALDVPVTTLHLQSGAWSNGVDNTLFHLLNNTADTVCKIDRGTQARVLLPFHLYDTQFNNMRAWQMADERPFELIVTLMPGKAAIQLDSPGLNSPGSQKGA